LTKEGAREKEKEKGERRKRKEEKSHFPPFFLSLP